MTTTMSYEENATCSTGCGLDAEIARARWQQNKTADETASADKSSTPDVSRGVNQIAVANIKDLSAVVSQLRSLWLSPVEDHRGKLRPVEDAFKQAVQLIVDGAIALNNNHDRLMPHGYVSPDFEGGIRIEWVRPLSSIHLVIPADATETYLYHEEGDVYGTDDDVTAEGLASRLQIIND